MKKWILPISFLALILGTFFQNCAKVQLEKEASESMPLFASASASLCLENDLQNFTLSSYYITNLNLVNRDDGLQIDVDGDGLSDFEEEKYGFDPLKRRSQSSVLDSICLKSSGSNQCQDLIPTCDSSEYLNGLNDCDLKVVGISSVIASSEPGIDTDGDDIPDFLEINKGTNPLRADDNSDPDNDGTLNGDELHQSSNSFYYDPNFPVEKKMKSYMEKVTNSITCTGELWKLSAIQIPWVMGAEFSDQEIKKSTLGLNFSHAADENTVLIWLKFTPKLGIVGLPRVYVNQFLVNKKNFIFNLSLSDFQFLGEVKK